MPFTLGLTYNSDTAAAINAYPPRPVGWLETGTSSGGAIYYQTEYEWCTYYNPYNHQGTQHEYEVYTNWQYYDIKGNIHSFDARTNTGNMCETASSSATAEDSEGWQIRITNYTGAEVIGPNGWQFDGPHGSTEDTNGNYVTSTTDTTGTTMLSVTSLTNCINPVDGQQYPSCIEYTVPSPNSGTVTWTEYVGNVQASLVCSGTTEYSTTLGMPEYIVMPDQFGDGGYAYYQFGYNGEGLMNSIRWPGGGTTAVTYGSLCGNTEYIPASLSITENDNNGNSGTTTFTAGSSETTVSFPDSSKQQISLYGTMPSDWKYYDTDGSTLLKEVAYDWATSPATKITYLGVVKMRERDTTYNTYDLPTNVTEVDYGRDSSGSTKSITTIAYEEGPQYITANILDKPTQIETTNAGGTVVAIQNIVYDAGGIAAYTTQPANWDSTYGISDYTRGNVGTISYMPYPGTVSEAFSRDETGQVVSTTLFNGNQESTIYGSGSCGNTYPTSQEVPGGTETMTYECQMGNLIEKQGPNGRTTTFGYDAYNRLTSIADPDGGTTTINFPSPTETEAVSAIDSSQSSTAYSYRDGFGRPTYSQTADGATTETVYDAFGRVAATAVPYSTGNPPGAGSEFTRTAYDGLGRPTTVTTPDGSKTSYSYAANAQEITSPSGVRRILEYGGFGHIWRVCEISGQSGGAACGLPISGSGFLTTYSYDMAGRLAGVSQGGQTRSWTYDTAGRMLTSDQPESGTTNYTYDSVSNSLCPGGKSASSGNLVFVQNAAGNQVCLTYDEWNRITQKTLSTGQTYTYTYDGSAADNSLGRLASATAPDTTETFAYDSMGRPITITEAPSGLGQQTISYTYNYLSEPLTEDGPARSFDYQYDNDGRLTGLWDNSDGYYFLGNRTFNAAGQVTAEDMSPGHPDQTAVAISYNNDDQPWEISYSNSGGVFLAMQYQWGSTVDANGDVTSDDDDGTLRKLIYPDDTNWTITYGHDDLGRLNSAVSADNLINVGATYDQFGNRDSQSGTQIEDFAASTSTNRIGGAFQYDAAGRVTAGTWGGAGSRTIAWNAAGRMTSYSDGSESASFEYDPFGRRIEATVNGQTTYYLYGTSDGGHPIAEYSASTGWQRYARDESGTFLMINAAGNGYYMARDALGTVDEALLSGAGTSRYYPFGEEAQSTNSEIKWTNQIRDANYLDHFAYRTYSSNLARWLSPDPAGLAAVSLSNPQSWNEYSYVLNNPASAADSLGLCPTPGADCIVKNVWEPGPPDLSLELLEMQMDAGFGPWKALDPSFRQYAALDNLLPGIGSGGNGEIGIGAKNAPQASCQIQNATSAVQTGVDQVKYTNAAGDWMILSGGSRDWATNNPDAVTNSRSAIGSYTGADVTSPIFATYSAGWNAASALWHSAKYQSAPSLVTALSTWTGNRYTANSGYVRKVLRRVPGATAQTPIIELSAAQLSGVQSGQQVAEGWVVGTAACGTGAR